MGGRFPSASIPKTTSHAAATPHAVAGAVGVGGAAAATAAAATGWLLGLRRRGGGATAGPRQPPAPPCGCRRLSDAVAGAGIVAAAAGAPPGGCTGVPAVRRSPRRPAVPPRPRRPPRRWWACGWAPRGEGVLRRPPLARRDVRLAVGRVAGVGAPPPSASQCTRLAPRGGGCAASVGLDEPCQGEGAGG